MAVNLCFFKKRGKKRGDTFRLGRQRKVSPLKHPIKLFT